MSPATKFLAAIVVLCILVSCSEAKRGCSSFGHSCYGGHGKRSVVPSIVDANNEVEQGTYSAPSRLIKILQQGNDDQVYAYPGESYDSMNRAKDYKIGLLNAIKQLLEESERKQQALHSNQLNLEDMN